MYIANNNDCLKEMEKTAKKMGYSVCVMQIFGDIKGAVTKILERISENQKTCIIFGGEPTVKVLGKGMGGRNQELVLRMLKNTQKLKKIIIASMGTDGIDGNSNFAGAITENIKIDLDVMKEFLKNSDSGRFFQKQKGNIVTDATHTKSHGYRRDFEIDLQHLTNLRLTSMAIRVTSIWNTSMINTILAPFTSPIFYPQPPLIQ